eukprot:TRINITY_DN1024_c0_g1_i11.p1 TRINITY_DN1024_c0_g1~~TRINITY_DN1024_c0_g1_i11.p1  ORF type:complete len:330 (+),score=21.49 TRINITY_DN1024_c0_g1_i11:64-990(+)
MASKLALVAAFELSWLGIFLALIIVTETYGLRCTPGPDGSLLIWWEERAFPMASPSPDTVLNNQYENVTTQAFTGLCFLDTTATSESKRFLREWVPTCTPDPIPVRTVELRQPTAGVVKETRRKATIFAEALLHHWFPSCSIRPIGVMEVRHTEVHKRVLQYAGAHEDECTRVHCPYSMVCVDPDWATYDDYWCECADGDLDCAADDFDRLAECSAEEIGMKVGWWFSVISTSVNLSLCIAILIEAVDVEVPLFNFARPWLKGFLPKKVPTSKLVFLQVAAGIITTINICVFTEQMIFGILFGLSIGM